jgi:hypothetical protein
VAHLASSYNCTANLLLPANIVYTIRRLLLVITIIAIIIIIIIIVIVIYCSAGVCLVIIADELLKKHVASKLQRSDYIVKFIIYIYTRDTHLVCIYMYTDLYSQVAIIAVNLV